MEASDHQFESIQEGQSESYRYAISNPVYEAMTEIFADKCPLHVDTDYARASGFAGRVMHGAVLQGFLSHFIGMHFPGRRSILMSVELRYVKPCYLGDEIRLSAKVTHKVPSLKAVELALEFHNQTQGLIVATGKCLVAVRGAGP